MTTINSKNITIPIKNPIGKYCKKPCLIFSKFPSNIITTNKKRTATAPTYTINKIIPTNSAPSIINKQAALTKSKIKKKTEWTVFLEAMTMIVESMVIVERK